MDRVGAAVFGTALETIFMEGSKGTLKQTNDFSSGSECGFESKYVANLRRICRAGKHRGETQGTSDIIDVLSRRVGQRPHRLQQTNPIPLPAPNPAFGSAIVQATEDPMICKEDAMMSKDWVALRDLKPSYHRP